MFPRLLASLRRQDENWVQIYIQVVGPRSRSAPFLVTYDGGDVDLPLQPHQGQSHAGIAVLRWFMNWGFPCKIDGRR